MQSSFPTQLTQAPDSTVLHLQTNNPRLRPAQQLHSVLSMAVRTSVSAACDRLAAMLGGLQVEGTCSPKHGYILAVLKVDDVSKVSSCTDPAQHCCVLRQPT